MADLIETSQWEDGTYRIETTDDVIGGETGIANIQGIQLGNRTRFLYDRLRDSGMNFAIDTGSLNTIVANVPAAPTAWVDGAEFRFTPAFTTTGASTFTANNGVGGVAAVPVYAGDESALLGGEITAGGSVTVRYKQALNSGAGGVVIIASTKAYLRAATPPAGDTSSAVATMAALFTAGDGMASVNVAGGTDVTLTKFQYGNAMLKITGTPTAAINLIFPQQTGHFVVLNQQGGSQNITAKTSAVGSTGIVVPQGVAVVLYNDGTNIGLASASGQSAFNIIPITGVTGSTLTVSGGYTAGAIFLEKNGLLLEPTTDYTAAGGSTIALTTAAVSTDKFNVYRFSSFSVANAVQKSGDTMAGPLLLAAGSTAPTPAANDNSTAIPNTAWAKSEFAGISTKNLAFAMLTTSGNFTTPANITASTVFKITLVGGGAGGGGSSGSGTVGGAGGAGGAATFYVEGLLPSTVYGVTIGAGGAGGTTAGNGGTGGTTSITIGAQPVYSVSGGVAGVGSSSAGASNCSAQGSVGSGIAGLASWHPIFSNQPACGLTITTGVFLGCNGASTLFGTGGIGGNAGAVPSAGTGYGAGGGAGSGNQNGAAGSAGLFIAEWVA